MADVKPLTLAEQEFIKQHEEENTAQLLLQGKQFRHLPLKELAHYIQARQKIKQKLPTWHQNLNIVYPKSISVEQSSSETTAAFKANLVAGNILIDLTGGFGIDSYFFSKKVKQVIYVERFHELAVIAAHNAHVLGAENITFQSAEAATFLQTYTGTADWIYLDPARRDNQNQKVHQLPDCEPNVLEILPLLLQKAANILLKTSPMLDIHQAIQDLGQVQKIYIIAVENECKEVLYHLTTAANTNPVLVTHNILSTKTDQNFTFNYADEENATVTYSLPQAYIYEPNAAILKSGGFKALAQAYGLNKLHRNSQVYTSDNLVNSFPGRVFRLKNISRYQKKDLLLQLPEKKANITVRNFPETVAQIRKKTGIKEGGNIYLFATADLNQKPVILVCEKA
ncbi:THUMP-like domain-containing protein [Adhaeribacter rhizoryzae]|uniref:Uncharacterized protein n=1 Tax=Adhaeribacter rhizoryzae TaxID=2607907 RepID=A0A5M6DME4_9BACT|nr:class I SAM-dependent methyltransferase [Adhaeribacter rhizoryzae]KAA5548717.1 hypothetical protein F0145_04160 [Adhaeribacter rhizoryzae]